MLIGLLRGKLERHLTRPAREIEDLLTATVLGSCCYVPAEAALLPFLSRAIDASDRLLGDELQSVVDATIDADSFWPRWARSTHEADPAGWNEPEVVLRLRRRDGTEAWVLIEAKLISGKSSLPREDGRVTDQLGKYWLDLRQRAADAGATALAIVYVTTGLRRTDADFVSTQAELHAKGYPPAPLYWLSWRSFVEVAESRPDPILRDVCRLLREQWRLAPVEAMRAWPHSTSPASRWTFASNWRWPAAQHHALGWSFEPGNRR